MAGPQSYATHVRRSRGWLTAFILAIVATPLLISAAIEAKSMPSVALALLAMSVLVAVGIMRVFVTRLQDRIIRLEMQLRLARLGRSTDLARVSLRQLIALRFAGDGELPALLDRTVADGLTPDAIKRAITDWQPDLIRV